MKLLKIIIQFIFFIILIFYTMDGWSQSVDSSKVDSIKTNVKFKKGKTDTTAKKKKTDKIGEKKSSQKEKKLKGFIDKDANGIDDRLQVKKGKGNKKKDLFIDKDGDGICDGQESAIGLKKTFRKRRRKGSK